MVHDSFLQKGKKLDYQKAQWINNFLNGLGIYFNELKTFQYPPSSPEHLTADFMAKVKIAKTEVSKKTDDPDIIRVITNNAKLLEEAYAQK